MIRAIYVRIFLSIWLAMLLVGVILVLLTVTSDARRGALGHRERPLRELGQTLVAAYEGGGPGALAREAARLTQEQGRPTFLFKGPGNALVPDPMPPGLPRLARAAEATGEVQRRREEGDVWVGLPLTGDYVVVTLLPLPSLLDRVFNPRLLPARLGVTFLFASGISILVARFLSAPIRKLRAATRRFADGDFAVRIAPDLGRSRDEIGELARDFDVMAERIDDLVSGQRRLVRDVSHELRSPLTRLAFALELLRRRCGPEATEPLDRIELETQRLTELIGQLLTLSTWESGAEPVEKSFVDLGALVSEIAGDAAFEAGQRGRGIDWAPCGEEVTVEGSAPMLRQAIDNVVRNALRYTKEGTSVELRLECRREPAGATAVVSVRDLGPGVPEDALPHLLEPFYRVAEARERQTGGTGIGLAIADRAARLHGGRVTVANAPGGGLLAEIHLPATVAGGPVG
ncbi:MAG: HAMP domain-containing protein [Deltaproteobacteria bacterium]|nr:HAMP domain-containing protein [Deltaproteobacteria bacterium]